MTTKDLEYYTSRVRSARANHGIAGAAYVAALHERNEAFAELQRAEAELAEFIEDRITGDVAP